MQDRPRRRNPRRPQPARTAIVGLLAAAAGSLACSPTDAPAPGALPTTIDLLARDPDRFLEQAGRLELSATDEWEEAGLGGWFPNTLPASSATPRAAVMNRPEARLLLSAVEPADRTLRFQAWVPADGIGALVPARDPASPGRFDVVLNGNEVYRGAAVGTEPAEFTIEVEEALWRFGDNVLTIRAPVFDAEARAGRTFDHLAVSALDYGPELLVQRDEHRLTLHPGSGLRYDLEPSGQPVLRLSGRSDGGGELVLDSLLVDPATGAIEAVGLGPRTLPVAAGDVALRLPLARRGDSILRLELTWRGEAPSSALHLEELELERCDGAPRPPIVFISIDTFSARHLASYGYGRVTTPNLDALLDEAVLFERCVANAPWTTPSYMSVLSGLFPRAHQIDPDGAGAVSLLDQWTLADNRWTLAEALRARGYETAGFVDTLWLDERFRVDQGFDLWDASAASESLPFEHPAYGVAYVTELARRWLRDLPAGRTPFLFLHALDAHGPYLPEMPFLAAFWNDLPEQHRWAPAGADYQAAGAVPEWMTRTLSHGIALPSADPLQHQTVPREVEVDKIIALYDAAILKVDAFVGRFLDTVRAEGLWDDAVVIVTGDHGEAFGEEYYGHARMYAEVLEVPLIVKFPGGLGAGERIKTGVQLVDLYPTLMELTSGRPAPAWLHGRSLLPLVRDGETEGVPLFSEGGHHEAYVLVQGDWKLTQSYPSREAGDAVLLTHPRAPRAYLEEHFPAVVGEPLTSTLLQELQAQEGYGRRLEGLRAAIRAGEPYLELYHLGSDPTEDHDLSGERPDKVQELLPLLEQHKRRSRASQATAIPGVALAPLSDAERARISELGYGESPQDSPPDADR